MIAQTLVEYGALQSISAALLNAYHRVEFYIGSIDQKYLLLLLAAAIVVLIWSRRRAA